MKRNKKHKLFNISAPSYKTMDCYECGNSVNKVSSESIKVLCSYCLLKKIPAPEPSRGYVPTGKPPGWHFMKVFVDVDGNVFYRGIEQPELKNTLPPSEIKPIVRKKRRSREEILRDHYKKKKEILRKSKNIKLGRPKKRGRGRPKGSKNKKKN